MSDVTTKLQKLADLQAREQKLNQDQEQLNKDIHDFMTKEFGLNGPHTLAAIVKKALESTIEPSRIIAP